MADLSSLNRRAHTSAPRETCVVCGGGGTPWLARRGRRLVRCGACGFTWVPEGLLHTSRDLSIYEDDELDLYAQDRDYYRDVGAIEAAREKLAWVEAHSRARGRLLDVGANVGSFVREAAARFEARGIEPNARTVAWGRAYLGADLEVGSIFQEVPAWLGRFDAVTLFDVIEHVDDPTAALRQCRRYLAPGGRLFITTPDLASLGARLLGRAWYYIDLDQHISMFPAASLIRLLASEGLRVVHRRTFGRRYRLSYIERRLKDLSHQSPVLRLAHLAALPLRLAPERHIPINLGDVVGLAVEATGGP